MRYVLGTAFDAFRNLREFAAIVLAGLLETVDDALDAFGSDDE